jgi:glycosyltransferase involved in cell wall biosynthesis
LDKTPIISVILPTFNRAYLIEKSIESVLKQTFTNFELLIIDDGSTDDTETVVQNINDPRIKYIKCIENKGASRARNIGIKNAQGEYIAFQDSDDEWYPNKLEMHMEAFKTASPDVGVVYTGLYQLTNDRKVYYPKDHSLAEGDMLSEILNKGGIWTVSLCIKKECFDVIGAFDETLKCFEDWELGIRLAKEFKFIYIDKASYDTYLTEGSLGSDRSAWHQSLEIILEKHKDDYEKNKKGLSTHCYNIGVWYCEHSDFDKGKKYLLKSIQAYPYHFKYYAKFIMSIFGERFYKTVIKTYRGLKRSNK